MHPFLAFLPLKERTALQNLAQFMTDEETVQFTSVLDRRFEDYVRTKQLYKKKFEEEGDSTVAEIHSVTKNKPSS